MKKENNHRSSAIPHRRYPSLSDDFGRENEITDELPSQSAAPGPDAGVRMVYHKTLGARPMRGTVERRLQDAIAAEVLEGKTGSGAVTVHPARDRLCLKPPHLHAVA